VKNYNLFLVIRYVNRAVIIAVKYPPMAVKTESNGIPITFRIKLYIQMIPTGAISNKGIRINNIFFDLPFFNIGKGPCVFSSIYGPLIKGHSAYIDPAKIIKNTVDKRKKER
jgi:hypothetical protein